MVRFLRHSGGPQNLTLSQTKAVAEAINEKDFNKAMSLRDPEFHESLDGFDATSALELIPHLPADKVCAALKKNVSVAKLGFDFRE